MLPSPSKVLPPYEDWATLPYELKLNILNHVETDVDRFNLIAACKSWRLLRDEALQLSFSEPNNTIYVPDTLSLLSQLLPPHDAPFTYNDPYAHLDPIDWDAVMEDDETPIFYGRELCGTRAFQVVPPHLRTEEVLALSKPIGTLYPVLQKLNNYERLVFTRRLTAKENKMFSFFLDTIHSFPLVQHIMSSGPPLCIRHIVITSELFECDDVAIRPLDSWDAENIDSTSSPDQLQVTRFPDLLQLGLLRPETVKVYYLPTNLGNREHKWMNLINIQQFLRFTRSPDFWIYTYASLLPDVLDTSDRKDCASTRRHIIHIHVRPDRSDPQKRYSKAEIGAELGARIHRIVDSVRQVDMGPKGMNDIALVKIVNPQIGLESITDIERMRGLVEKEIKDGLTRRQNVVEKALKAWENRRLAKEYRGLVSLCTEDDHDIGCSCRSLVETYQPVL